MIAAETRDAAPAALDDDFAQGRYKQADLLWRATPERADGVRAQLTARAMDLPNFQ